MTDQTPGHDARAPYGGTPSAPPANGAGYGATGPDAGTKKTLGLVGLILGIVGILIGVLLVPFLGLALGIVALVLGVMSRRREPAARGLATGAIVTGVLAIVASIAMWIYSAIVIAEAING